MGRGDFKWMLGVSAMSAPSFALPACGGQCPSCPSTPAVVAPLAVVAPASSVSAQGAPAPIAPAQSEREKIAVLPLRDRLLFRSERRELRQLLISELARKLPAHDILSITEADAQIALRTNGDSRCAEGDDAQMRRAFRKGWLATSLTHVFSVAKKPEQLWVEVVSAVGTEQTLQALWNSRLPQIERYRAAFASMVVIPQQNGGPDLIGGIAASPGSVSAGPLRLCERMRPFDRCTPESKAFGDQASAFAQCFSNADEADLELLFEPSGSCELAELDDPSSADGRREQCLCAALRSSSGANANAGRRSLSMSFEAADLAGKARPELRVVEASGNLRAKNEWHDVRMTKDAKTISKPMQRLGIDGLDRARAPLSRCAMPAGTLVIADVVLGAAGTAEAVSFVAGAPSKQSATCLRNALSRSTWACTEDGKRATLRLAMSWLE